MKKIIIGLFLVGFGIFNYLYFLKCFLDIGIVLFGLIYFTIGSLNLLGKLTKIDDENN